MRSRDCPISLISLSQWRRRFAFSSSLTLPADCRKKRGSTTAKNCPGRVLSDTYLTCQARNFPRCRSPYRDNQRSAFRVSSDNWYDCALASNLRVVESTTATLPDPRRRPIPTGAASQSSPGMLGSATPTGGQVKREPVLARSFATTESQPNSRCTQTDCSHIQPPVLLAAALQICRAKKFSGILMKNVAVLMKKNDVAKRNVSALLLASMISFH